MKNICIVLQYLDNENVISILRASSVTVECLQSAAAFSPPPLLLQWSWGSSRCHEVLISWAVTCYDTAACCSCKHTVIIIVVNIKQ